jgi:hypothetical protein
MKKELQQFIPFLATYGERYRKTYLRIHTPQRLLDDWWAAFKFFLGLACNVGRCDEHSALVNEAALKVLSPLFSGLDGPTMYIAHKTGRWVDIENQLRKRIGSGVGKGGDVLMIKSVLDFVGELPDLNLVRHSVGELRAGRTAAHYSQLKLLYQVGDKIASLYLRDVVSLFRLDANIPDNAVELLMPIDTHVRHVAVDSGIANRKMTDPAVRKAIVDACRTVGVSPLLVDQGSWFIRKNYPGDLNAKLRSMTNS